MLNNIGLPGLLLIAVVVLVLFGRGKISNLMGEVGKGITAFKKGVNDGTKEIEENASVEISLDDLFLIVKAIQDAYETGLKDCLTIADSVVDDLRKETGDV